MIETPCLCCEAWERFVGSGEPPCPTCGHTVEQCNQEAVMPDMTDLPQAREIHQSSEALAEIEQLKAEVESLRLRTPEDNVRYWLSDEAMKNE